MGVLKHGWHFLAGGTMFAATALLSVPLAAQASDVRQTSAFKVELPSGWELKIKEKPSNHGKHGAWVFSSPRRNQRVFIRIGQNRQGPIADQWNAFVGAYLGQSLLNITTEGYVRTEGRDGEVAYGTIYGAGRRNTKTHIYKYGVVVMRNPEHKRVAYIAVGGTKDGWDAAFLRVERIMKTLELK